MFGTILISAATLMHLYLFWRILSVPYLERHVPRGVIVGAGAIIWAILFLGRVIGHSGTGAAAATLEFLAMSWLGVLFLSFIPLLAVDLVDALRAAPEPPGAVAAGRGSARGGRAFVDRVRTGPAAAGGERLRGETARSSRCVGRNGARGAVGPAPRLARSATAGWRPGSDKCRRCNRTSWCCWATSSKAMARRRTGGSRPSGSSPRRRASGPSPAITNFTPAATWACSQRLASSCCATHGPRCGPVWFWPGSTISPLRAAAAKPATSSLRPSPAIPPGPSSCLSHTPWQAEKAAAAGAGLMLSGHTHGGQIWPFGCLVERRYPLLGGRYGVDGMPVIVSRGTGTWGPRMRLWRPGEILRVTLRGKGGDFGGWRPTAASRPKPGWTAGSRAQAAP